MIIDEITDNWPDTRLGWLSYSDRYEIVEGVLEALRALPVEQRMEAMGMELDTIECGEHYDGRHWVETVK